MAEKELPPLRVRITGDSKELSAAVDSAIKNIQKAFSNIKLDIAVQHAKELKTHLNGIRLKSMLMQIKHLRSGLQDVARIKLSPLDSEVGKLLKKFERLNKIYANLQKGAFAGTGGGGGPGGQVASVLAAAAASIARSMADALIKAAPHAGKAMAQTMTTGLREAGRVLTAVARQLGPIFRTFSTLLASFTGTLRTLASVISSGANIFRSVANVAVAGLRAGATLLSTAIRSGATVLASSIRFAGQIVSTSIRTAGQLAGNAIRGVSRVVSTTIQQGGRIASQAIRSAGQVASQAIRSAGQVAARAITAAVQGYAATTRMVSSVFATVGRTIVGLSRSASTVISTSIRSSGQVAGQAIRSAFQMGSQAMRTAGQVISQSIRSSARAASRSTGGGGAGMGGMGSLGQGLTSRADIYMHANAMRALVQSGKGLLDLRINLQYAEVGIQAFTGNAQQAAVVMQEIKDHAEKTSFTRLGLADATRNMMSYGMSAKSAIEHIKMLGDVAGGNELRFERLSFAMSQITSMGRLQGQELRQLTEQGFNPLETMSRHTGRSMLELKQMMEDGAISATHVTEALRIETAAGGRFADMQMKMAKSLGGLRAQLIETINNIKIELVGAIENDLKVALSTVIGYLKQFEAFMRTPAGAALIARIMNIAKIVFAAVLAFHAIGFAVAAFLWWMQSAVSTVSRLLFIFRGLSVAASVLAAIISSPFYLVLIGIAAAVAAVLYFTGTLNGPGSIYAAIMDLWNLLTGFFTNVVGFFYNFGNNWTMLVQWFGKNWQNLIGDLMEGSVRVFFAMLENAQTMIRMMGRLFVVFFTWLLTSYQNLFSGDVYNAVVNGFIRVFTWLEDKWKMFGDFVGKIWENLFDPAALYDVLMEGMGINETASKMTDDIAITMEKGLFAGMDKVINEEMGNFKTGLEDMDFQTEALPQFDVTVPQWPPPAAPPQLPPAGAYTGPGFDGMGAGRADITKVQDTMAFRGSDYNKKLAEQSGRFDAVGKAKNPQLAAQQQTNTLLGKIFAAITQQQPVVVQGAGIGGTP